VASTIIRNNHLLVSPGILFRDFFYETYLTFKKFFDL
jgi:hypothetical protein